MALQGTLKDFSITEIIQLIGQQLKTGVLKICRGKSTVEIYFVDGMIVHVFFNYLGEILVELQLLTKDDVLKVISTQIYETIYDLFWWEDGTFSFDLKLV